MHLAGYRKATDRLRLSSLEETLPLTDTDREALRQASPVLSD